MNMQLRGAAIAEAVQAPRRHDQRLSRGQRHMLFVDPHVGLPFVHRQHFLYRMTVRRRADTGRDPLFENAELRGAVARGD